MAEKATKPAKAAEEEKTVVVAEVKEIPLHELNEMARKGAAARKAAEEEKK